MRLLVLLVFSVIATVYSNQQGCLFDNNIYFAFENVTDTPTNQLVHVTGYSKNPKRWFGIGFSKDQKLTTDSILIISYSTTVLQYKNQTKNSTQDYLSANIINFPIIQKKGFEFFINISKLVDKKYLFFAYDNKLNIENVIPSTSSIKFFNISIYDNLKDLSKTGQSDYCSENIGVPGRLFITHDGFFIPIFILYIFLMIWCLYLTDKLPLRSKGSVPIFLVACYLLNLIFERIEFELSYELNTIYACWLTIYGAYPSLFACEMAIIYIFCHYILVKSMTFQQHSLHEKGLKRSTSSEIISPIFKTSWRVSLFKAIRSKYFMVGLLTFAYLFESIILTIPILVFQGKCTATARTITRFVHGGFMLGAIGIWFVVQLVDLLINWRIILVCKLKKYFIDDDIYYFRLESLFFLGLLSVGAVWISVSKPKIIGMISVEIILVLGWIAIGGVLTLLITTFKYCFPQKKKINEINEIEEIFKDEELYLLFYRQARKEYSLENVLFRVDSMKYKTMKNKKKREEHAIMMVEKYLSGSSSPFEINVDFNTISKAVELIREGRFDDNIFDDLDYCIYRNLSDTYSRFIHSSEFSRYQKEMKDIKLRSKVMGSNSVAISA
eukprot:gene10754-3373_t